jgi:glycine/D-amino acid oxidase-like deaminating enzyme
MKSEYCVIGNGPIGAALTLELAKAGRSVTLVGARYGADNAWFSAHEDDTRIVRLFHADPFWERLTRANLACLAELGEVAGETLYRRAPVFYRFGLMPRPASAPLHRIADEAWPFAEDYFDAEDDVGGVLDPRRYVAALNRHALGLGAQLVERVVDTVRRIGTRYAVSYGGGQLECERVVSASGFHANTAHLHTRIHAKVLAYVQRVAGAVERPFCFVDYSAADNDFADVYGICNYRLCDGRVVSKFGFSDVVPIILPREGIAAWFAGDYARHPALGSLHDWIRRFGQRAGVGFAPTLRVRPCAFVTTTSGRPVVGIDGGHIQVAGCNGMAAKCCQALARSVLVTLGELDTAAGEPLEQVVHHA